MTLKGWPRSRLKLVGRRLPSHFRISESSFLCGSSAGRKGKIPLRHLICQLIKLEVGGGERKAATGQEGKGKRIQGANPCLERYERFRLNSALRVVWRFALKKSSPQPSLKEHPATLRPNQPKETPKLSRACRNSKEVRPLARQAQSNPK